MNTPASPHHVSPCPRCRIVGGEMKRQRSITAIVGLIGFVSAYAVSNATHHDLESCLKRETEIAVLAKRTLQDAETAVDVAQQCLDALGRHPVHPTLCDVVAHELGVSRKAVASVCADPEIVTVKRGWNP